MQFFAHTDPDHPDPGDAARHWEPLFTPFGEGPDECRQDACKRCESLDRFHGHLNKVAWWTAKFAAEMFPPGPDRESAHQWGTLTGLWHDLGKFAPEWQDYLEAKSDPHSTEIAGKLDHSSAGARHAVSRIPHVGTFLAYLIAGHHAGLADGISDSNTSLENRLRLRPTSLDGPPELLAFANTLPPIPLASDSGPSHAFFLRFLFSALADADFLSTEAFMSADRARFRPTAQPSIAALESTLTTHLENLASKARPSPVNQYRANILRDCRSAANAPPGLFSLTVPTGGGKTLSSLAFAVSHARIHDLRRIIYVIPYTSIIEQNAAVFREALSALGPDVVLEHHSSFDPDKETTTSRLATENWDARLIVTTNVQFFDSLHAHKTSRCRKLHRIARSVVILDEAQSLPTKFLAPCLRTLEELTAHYQTSVVLCTATQPAIIRNDEFKIGLQPPREIIPDPADLYQSLRRVTTTRLPGKTLDEPLIHHLRDHPQALCIVNTRRHARCLFDLLPNDPARFHLSALVCPEHRTEKLRTIKHRLDTDLSVHLISTQLIEAGVDIDFPVVFRALAGLDSIAQSAGRCDREGRLTAAAGTPAGRLFLFEPPAAPPPGFLASTAASAAEVLSADPTDPLDLSVIESYFRTHYWKHENSTDEKNIRDCWPREPLRHPRQLLQYKFKTCGETFRLIDNDYTQPVLIPYGDKGRHLCDLLRETFDPSEIRDLARKLQRFTVNIPPHQHAALLRAGILIPLHDTRFFLLNSAPHYDDECGLHPEPDLTLDPCHFLIAG